MEMVRSRKLWYIESKWVTEGRNAFGVKCHHKIREKLKENISRMATRPIML